MIKVEYNNKTIEGEFFTVDPVSKAIVLKVNDNYVIVNSSQISSIKGDLTACKAPAVGELGIRYVM